MNELNGDALDAARWRALLASARIRPLGCAGIVKPNEAGHAHLGLELWTHYPAEDCSEAEQARGIEWLTKYVDIARGVA